MISDQLLFVLKICLLILLYLFLFRVVRAVWAELKPVAAPAPVIPPVPAPVPTPPRPASAGGQLIVIEPAATAGKIHVVDGEVTIGRGAGCAVVIDDTHVSQLHARLFARGEDWWIEDLGSTNGTFVNRRKVTAPVIIHRGERINVGSTVLELR